MARTLFALMVLLSVVWVPGLGFSESAPMIAVGPAKTPMGHHLLPQRKNRSGKQGWQCSSASDGKTHKRRQQRVHHRSRRYAGDHGLEKSRPV